jgi:hypothetical protein
VLRGPSHQSRVSQNDDVVFCKKRCCCSPLSLLSSIAQTSRACVCARPVSALSCCTTMCCLAASPLPALGARGARQPIAGGGAVQATVAVQGSLFGRRRSPRRQIRDGGGHGFHCGQLRGLARLLPGGVDLAAQVLRNGVGGRHRVVVCLVQVVWIRFQRTRQVVCRVVLGGFSSSYSLGFIVLKIAPGWVW